MSKKKKKAAADKSDKDPVWQHVMKDVDPLSSDLVPPHELLVDTALSFVEPPPVTSVQARPLRTVQPSPPPPPPEPPLTHGDIQRLDKRTGQKFTGGRMNIAARLDLHGMTEAQAHGALHRFVDSCWARQLRCVLVVTGKGLQSENGIGVLRAAVPQWLNDPDLRARVLSFSHAQPKDGGEGALYVLLKRQR